MTKTHGNDSGGKLLITFNTFVSPTPTNTALVPYRADAEFSCVVVVNVVIFINENIYVTQFHH